jgi:hypothetical protein
MKSTDVYKIINLIIKDELKISGYKKTKSGMLGFYKKIEYVYIVFWFQCSQNGFDPYSGSKFTIEFQVSESNDIGTKPIKRNRIARFFNEKELKEIIDIENKIRKNLPKPPKDYPILLMEKKIVKWYKENFEKIKSPYSNSIDIWFKYHKETDVENWAKYLLNVIKRIINQLEDEARTNRLTNTST